jgi:hypothetical protein
MTTDLTKVCSNEQPLGNKKHGKTLTFHSRGIGNIELFRGNPAALSPETEGHVLNRSTVNGVRKADPPGLYSEAAPRNETKKNLLCVLCGDRFLQRSFLQRWRVKPETGYLRVRSMAIYNESDKNVVLVFRESCLEQGYEVPVLAVESQILKRLKLPYRLL